MYISDKGLNLIKEFEGCYLTAYMNLGEEYWTIGWGHYGPDVYEGMTITQEEADNMLITDMADYCADVDLYALSKFPNLNQNQYDALVSYDYNRGPGGLKELVNNSNTIEELGNNITVYWGSNTNYYNGLMRRRRAEQNFFRSGESGGTPLNPDDGGGGGSSGDVTLSEHAKKIYALKKRLVRRRIRRFGGLCS